MMSNFSLDALYFENAFSSWKPLYQILKLKNKKRLLFKVYGEMKMRTKELLLNSLHCGKVKIAMTSMDSINHIINLECKGTLYPVRVCEEQIIVSKSPSDQCTSQPTEWKNAWKTTPKAIADEQLIDISSRHEVEDDDVDIQLGKKVDL